MKTTKFLALLWAALFFLQCDTARKTVAAPGQDDGILECVFLQMNDVYEISPSPSDNSGGLARVAAIRQELLRQNPNVITVLAGDFISPSVIGTLRHEGKRIRGKHMVEVLNTLGLDWVVFGNHEFDYDDLADLQARLDESNFGWLAANARLKGQTWTQQFFKNRNGGTEICPDNQVIALKDADGTTLNLGLFGVLINSGRKPWVEYSDWAAAAQKNYAELSAKTDVVVALTHLDVAEDKKLAAMLPQIPLFMGGHDHDNQLHKVGNSSVAKADANARTVYVHTLRYDKKRRQCSLKSQLRRVDGSVAEEPQTAAVVAKWEKIKQDALNSAGFNASAVVTRLDAPLDCRDAVTRHGQAPVGNIITLAMQSVSRQKPQCVLLNSGSIRVDDVLSGTLTELDIVRMLPFGGAIVEVEMRGGLLRKTLDAGRSNKGGGGYLQWLGIARNAADTDWLVDTKALDDKALYRVTLPEFLLTGSEANMAFLKAAPDAQGKSSNPDIPTILRPDAKDKSDLRNDVRLALIDFWRRQ
jgi:2',3'-cyclic-nucleotide 2'-phosphodiesterase (5'-nucleotidase family)